MENCRLLNSHLSGRCLENIIQRDSLPKAPSRNKGDGYCAEIVSDFKAHPLGHSNCAMFQGWNAESRNKIKQELQPLFLDSA
jgi:hypothetical protein